MTPMYTLQQWVTKPVFKPVIAAQLRAQVPGLRLVHAGGGNFKKQLKRADKSGAEVALILGEDELEQGVVTVKYLREEKPQATHS